MRWEWEVKVPELGTSVFIIPGEQDLLGHRSARITTHYSAAELSQLIEAANRVCESNRRQPELVVLRRRVATA